jgi:hypothetical protein
VAGLQLRSKPRPPGPASFIFMHVDHIHESWRPYIAVAAS